jgi:S1-C subfamily serine protease
MRLLLAFVLFFTVVHAQAAIPPSNVVRVFVEDKGNEQSGGTGALVRSDLVVTNWHVVKDRAGTIRIVFPNWEVFTAEIVKMDKRWDLAALRITVVGIPPIEFGEKPQIGETVTVGGYGSGWYETDTGKVTGYCQPDRKSPADLISINAKVRNGDSGGPILREGKLVGILFGCHDDTYGINIERVCKFLETIK